MDSQKVEVSILLVSKRGPIYFQQLIDSLKKTCSNPKKVEILCKLDTEDCVWEEQYINIAKVSGFICKVFISPQGRGYFDSHIFVNMLADLVVGENIWIVGDRTKVIYGDWLSVFKKYRNKYSDNIYLLHIINSSTPRSLPAPILSKEWIKFFGNISPIVPVDSYLFSLAVKIGRKIMINDVCIEVPTKRSTDRLSKRKIDYGEFKRNVEIESCKSYEIWCKKSH